MAEGTDNARSLLERLGPETIEGGSTTLISASFEDGTALAVRGVRPDGTAGHDGAELAAFIAPPDEEPTPMAEVLLSTEYDSDGAARRIGLELYEEPDSVPMRVAGDREGEPVSSGDGERRTASKMTFRFEGRRGVGIHEVVVAA